MAVDMMYLHSLEEERAEADLLRGIIGFAGES